MVVGCVATSTVVKGWQSRMPLKVKVVALKDKSVFNERSKPLDLRLTRWMMTDKGLTCASLGQVGIDLGWCRSILGSIFGSTHCYFELTIS